MARFLIGTADYIIIDRDQILPRSMLHLHCGSAGLHSLSCDRTGNHPPRSLLTSITIPPFKHLFIYIPSHFWSMAISTFFPHLSESIIVTKLLNLIGPSRVTPLPGNMSMTPTMAPELLVTPRLSPYGAFSLSLNNTPATSYHSLGEAATTGTSLAGSTASSFSIPFEDGDVDVVRVDGLRHAYVKLDAR